MQATYHPDYSGNHRLNGIVVMHGPGIRSGGMISDARLRDVTPSVLYLLGLPARADMEGRVITEAMTPEDLRAMAPTTVPTYETARARGGLRPVSSSIDEDTRQRLKALGYLQ
jgi:hypothetical protein